jgi:hypothetical protein
MFSVTPMAQTGSFIMDGFEDHGLPLVQLKEQRRELVVALIGRKDPISNFEIAEIASLQQAIAAMEAVVGDLDSQIEFSPPRRQAASPVGIAKRRTTANMGFMLPCTACAHADGRIGQCFQDSQRQSGRRKASICVTK